MSGATKAGPRPGEASPPSASPDKPARVVPGQPDMWMLVLFEALVFTAYLGVYLFHRAARSAAFLSAQAHLDQRFGILNTLLMLTSSLFMLRCVQASRAGALRPAMTSALVTAALGTAFLASKITEWTLLIRAGHTFTSGEFFQYYFFLTGIHCLHVLIGFVAIGVITWQLRRRERRSQEVVETCAVYWHSVDLLWVLIFSLLYVVR